MKVIFAVAMSANGLIAAGKADTSWISEEDKKLFTDIRLNADAVIMGGNVYRAIRKNLKLEGTKIRIVITRSPQEYTKEAVKGKLEFTSESPQKIIARLKNEGRQNVLLAGGSVSNLFVKDGLVDEFHLTLEPVYITKGRTLNDKFDFLNNLKLISTTKLNSRGTLYSVYKFGG